MNIGNTKRGVGLALFTLGALSVVAVASDVIAQPFDRPMHQAELDALAVAEQPAVLQINADDAHVIATGDGIRVAVLDGGFDLDHELWDSVDFVSQYDAVDDDTDINEAPNGIDDDADGVVDRGAAHGNFVTSVIHAGAPDATIIPVRVLDDEGNGTADDLAAGIDHARLAGADVINISAVITSSNQTLKDALKDATTAGITIVTAAGNTVSGAFNDGFVRARTITVGAVDEFDAVTPWSPSGSEVDIYAPGLDVLGALDVGVTDYGTWDGTSFAAPWVSAAAALSLEDDPTRTPKDVRDLLTDTVAPVTGTTGNHGRVDCDAAVNE